MFTLEINGKPIAVTDADEAEAHELLGGSDFKEDLISLESDGRPLWDGTAPLTVRRSSDDEMKSFEEAMEENDEERNGEADGEEVEDEDLANIVFLVSLDEDIEQEDARAEPPQHQH